MNIYGIGISALNAAQAGIATTTHNIANAGTAGYSRQEIIQTAQLPQSMGAGYFGQGVNVTNVVRRYDQFLGAQVLEAQTQASNLSTQLGLSQQVSNLLGDSSGGLTPVMQDFFSAVNAVSNAPQSVAARQTMLASAQSLAGRFQSLDQNLNQIRDGLNGQISSSVASINSIAKQIATLNDKIVQLQANTPNQEPNDLLDQRDQLVSQLSQEIRVSTLKQSDGTMNVFIGSGQSLVVGNRASTLQTVTSATDPTALEVAYSNNGTVSTIPQNSLQGGNLGGYLSFRQDVLDPAVNALGRIAMGLADTFNQQHKQGVDLKGDLGGNLFAMATPRVTPSSNNTGSGVITATVTSTSALTARDYSVRFDGANYQVYDTTTNTQLGASITPGQMAAGQAIPVPVVGSGIGITLQLTAGAVATGDSFLVRPTVNGASGISLSITDPTKIAAASPVRSNASTANLGTGVIAAATVVPGLPLNANLQNPINITFTVAAGVTTYTVTDVTIPASPVVVAANVPYVSGQTISYNGWSTQVSGVPSNGDTFTVRRNTNATTDGTNILLMAALQTANTLVNGTASYQGTYGQLIGQVGSQTRELTVTSQAQTNLLDQITKSQQAVSGVNLDEEAANLLRYQQAYQAAGKAIQIANTMFETILNLK
jgi:flagellar hook-associated protein 1 FlgK